MISKQEISAGGIIYKKENNTILWLIVRPNQEKKWWSFPKGKIGDKVRQETKEQAALREVKEETGIHAEILSFPPAETHYMYRFQNYLIKKTVYLYLMEYISENEEHKDQEIAELKWVKEEQALTMITYKGDKQAFIELKEVFKQSK